MYVEPLITDFRAFEGISLLELSARNGNAMVFVEFLNFSSQAAISPQKLKSQ